MHVHAQYRPRSTSISRGSAAALAAVAVLTAAGCGADVGSSTAADAGATPAPADGAPDDAGTSRSYDTAQFAVPLTVAVDPALDPEPTIDSPHLLSFETEADDEFKVRFLVPTVTYAPGTSTAAPPPADFLAYLHAQAPNGLVLTEEVSTVVDGRPTTLLTATSEPGGSYDGSLGCPTPDTPPPDCFGVQPEYVLRLAVVSQDPGEAPVLVWARRYTGHDAPEFVAAFEAMLQTVQFR